MYARVSRKNCPGDDLLTRDWIYPRIVGHQRALVDVIGHGVGIGDGAAQEHRQRLARRGDARPARRIGENGVVRRRLRWEPIAYAVQSLIRTVGGTDGIDPLCRARQERRAELIGIVTWFETLMICCSGTALSRGEVAA